MASDGFFSKEKFIDILNAKADMALGTSKQVFYSVVKMLEALPAADVAEVVRCRDCKHWKHEEDVDFVCTKHYGYRLSTDFCSYGERKAPE